MHCSKPDRAAVPKINLKPNYITQTDTTRMV